MMLDINSIVSVNEEVDPEEVFELLDLLGQGAYGTVSKALHKQTGELYAIKIITMTSGFSEVSSIKKEIQILKQCDDEHIVKYYGSYFKDNNLWIILQYCAAGSIIDLLNITKKTLTEEEIALIIQSVLLGLVYLHSNKKIHRDIKAANILINEQGVAKLADFGVSAESLHTNANHKTQAGSPCWMSPEVMKSNLYTLKTDIWSLGVTSIELAEGTAPFSHLKPYMAIFTLKDKPIQGFSDPSRWSPDFNSFVKDCLQVNPQQRPSAKELLNHPFIKNNTKYPHLLGQLVARSLAEIQQFRMGQQNSNEFADMAFELLNGSRNCPQTKTIVNHRERSKQSFQIKQVNEKQEKEDVCFEFDAEVEANNSMIMKEDDEQYLNGSVIVKCDDQQGNQFKTNCQKNDFMQYVNNLKSQLEVQNEYKQKIKTSIIELDAKCLIQIEEVFQKHKSKLKDLLFNAEYEKAIANLEQIGENIDNQLNKSATVTDFLMAMTHHSCSRNKQMCSFEQTHNFNISDMKPTTNDTSEKGTLNLTNSAHGFPANKSKFSNIESIIYQNHQHQKHSEKLRCKFKRFISTEPQEANEEFFNEEGQNTEQIRKWSELLEGDHDLKNKIYGEIEDSNRERHEKEKRYRNTEKAKTENHLNEDHHNKSVILLGEQVKRFITFNEAQPASHQLTKQIQFNAKRKSDDPHKKLFNLFQKTTSYNKNKRLSDKDIKKNKSKNKLAPAGTQSQKYTKGNSLDKNEKERTLNLTNVNSKNSSHLLEKLNFHKNKANFHK